jgi:putative hydrolase of the HAD superfamily
MKGMAIKLIVFDLDDTLLDTTTLLIPIARTPEFEKRIREPLPLMPGALENLQMLKTKYKLVLLTQGRTDAQEAKVASCGIKEHFTAYFIADPKKSETKYDFFLKIKRQFQLQDGEFLSIGNRRSTDIREAKRAGGLTCLFKYGEHQNELPEVPQDHPDFETISHKDLIQICRL